VLLALTGERKEVDCMQKKILRCQHPTLGEPKCRKKARWSVAGYFDGRLQFSIRFCSQHLEQWKERMKKAEPSWEFEIQELA
jgi:hypothetical protein